MFSFFVPVSGVDALALRVHRFGPASFVVAIPDQRRLLLGDDDDQSQRHPPSVRHAVAAAEMLGGDRSEHSDTPGPRGPAAGTCSRWVVSDTWYGIFGCFGTV